jgi:uncharacterized iron-regulated membrane protein
MIVVSALGAMLVGLVVSGLFAHPRLFRDAFNLRLKGSALLEQVDMHNRLSVWGMPFHLMIVVTGAYFGLALPFLAVAANEFFNGDREAAIEAVFGQGAAAATGGGATRHRAGTGAGAFHGAGCGTVVRDRARRGPSRPTTASKPRPDSKARSERRSSGTSS